MSGPMKKARLAAGLLGALVTGLTGPSILVTSLLATKEAQACGGFFCDQVPVDQTAEQILFSVKDGLVTAQIQINYAGTAEDFAWVIPLPTEPSVPTVGSNAVFTELANNTRAQFNLTWHEGSCGGYYGGFDRNAEADSGGSECEGEGPPVNVSFQGAVGPYETAILNSDDADALRTWLIDNGYDVPEEAAALIDPYVAEDNWFVALKLLSESDVGDLQPIIVTFPFNRPCVPLRLTAIASIENLGVRMWVVGDGRAIPTNYNHVLIDEAKIDWLCGANNYTDVITEAANESGGRAFVTEFAGPSQLMAGKLYTDDRFDLDALQSQTHPAAFVQAVALQPFARDTQLLAVLTDNIPPPADLPDQDWINLLASCECTSDSSCNCYDTKTDAYIEGLAFDPVAATADIDTRIVQPLKAAQELIDASPYLTEMFTTISPDEMNIDPMFGFNSDLPDVSNVHTADVYPICSIAGPVANRLVLADGREIFLSSDDYGCGTADASAPVGTLARLKADLPGSEISESLVETGQGNGKVLYSKTAQIDQVIAAHNEALGFGSDGNGCGCSLGANPGAAPIGVMLLVAAIVLSGTRIRNRTRER